MAEMHDEYLWDPKSTPDPHVTALEELLRPHGARALGLEERALPRVAITRRPKQWRRMTALAASVALVALAAAWYYRLTWADGAPWSATTSRAAPDTPSAWVHVGQRVATDATETLTLQAARIGTVVVGPDSAIRLTQTGRGGHRLALEKGSLRARVWAPPGYFGVSTGSSLVLDFGCEFELTVTKAGAGTLAVSSGWVAYLQGSFELMVPEHHYVRFDVNGASTPLRADAADELRKLVGQMDAELARTPRPDASHLETLAASVASAAEDADYLTLLSLLTRHPSLAQSALYPRLGSILSQDPITELHRARWARGEREAINLWWHQVPRRPKAWWLNWRDAL